MKRDFFKKAIVLSLTSAVFIANTAFASTSNSGSDLKMSDVYVQGQKYKSVVKGHKTKSNKTISVLVTRMLKDDGDSSNYQYSWWQINNVTDGVCLNAGKQAEKNKVCKIPLNRKTSTSKKISVAAKGNKDYLDTIITGYIFDFKK